MCPLNLAGTASTSVCDQLLANVTTTHNADSKVDELRDIDLTITLQPEPRGSFPPYSHKNGTLVAPSYPELGIQVRSVDPPATTLEWICGEGLRGNFLTESSFVDGCHRAHRTWGVSLWKDVVIKSSTDQR